MGLKWSLCIAPLRVTTYYIHLTEAEKAAKKAEEEKAKELAPVKANIKARDLQPVRVSNTKQEPDSNGSSDFNSPTNSSDHDDGSGDSSDNANQSDSDDSSCKVDSSNASDHDDHTDHKDHADNGTRSNKHKHMNGSAFEKTEFHNKMNKLEERHTISTVQTLQIPGGSEVRTVQTVELRKITTNGTQQATFKNHNHEE